MKATIKDFFGSNLEQEVLDEVVILPVKERTNTGVFSLPFNVVWTDFEYVEIHLGINAVSGASYGTSIVNRLFIEKLPTSWRSAVSWSDQTGKMYRADVIATGESSGRWSSFATGSDTIYPKLIVGYKRRISRVGIDELMSAMSLPNLIANADLTDNPINQRSFNGDWASLAIGDYGYDQWMKVSDTHMGYVIEAGKYRPNAKHTLTKDDVVIGEFMSPASGHWIVSVPFATSGKFDLYAGQFKRPWHPVQDGVSLCRRFYQAGAKEVEYLTSIYRDTAPWAARGWINLTHPMRKIVTPSVNNAQWYWANTYQWESPSSLTLFMRSPDSIGIDLIGPGSGVHYQCIIARFGYEADASITLAEVGGQITTIG